MDKSEMELEYKKESQELEKKLILDIDNRQKQRV